MCDTLTGDPALYRVGEDVLSHAGFPLSRALSCCSCARKSQVSAASTPENNRVAVFTLERSASGVESIHFCRVGCASVEVASELSEELQAPTPDACFPGLTSTCLVGVPLIEGGIGWPYKRL